MDVAEGVPFQKMPELCTYSGKSESKQETSWLKLGTKHSFPANVGHQIGVSIDQGSPFLGAYSKGYSIWGLLAPLLLEFPNFFPDGE